MMADYEDFQIHSQFFTLCGLVGKQFELEEMKEEKEIVDQVFQMDLKQFSSAYQRIEKLKLEKRYLFSKMKLMIDFKFLMIGMDSSQEQDVEYFHQALEKLKELQDSLKVNPKLVLDSYASFIKQKLSMIQDWRLLDSWMDLVWKMKKTFDYNISAELDCAECCYTVVVNRFLQNKKFEAGSGSDSADICQVMLWLNEKVHKDGMRLEYLKGVFIDAALDYVQELDQKEVMKGKEERVYLNRIIEILETIQKVGFEDKAEHLFIEKRFNNQLLFFKSISSEVNNPEPIVSKDYFKEFFVIECLQIDEDIRKGWKCSTKNEKTYFIKFYIERKLNLEARVSLERDFYKYLSTKKDFYPRYFGSYSDQKPSHKEYGIILEHSNRSLRSELDLRKSQKNPFKLSEIMNLALILLTTLSDLHSSTYHFNGLRNAFYLSHLDIRAENIIMTEENHWKLTNYNLFLHVPSFVSESFISSLAKDNMSPELKSSCESLNFQFVPSKCDIFSVCKTLLEVEAVSSSRFPEEFQRFLLQGTSADSRSRPSAKTLRDQLLPHFHKYGPSK